MLYALILRIAALFHPKAKLFIEGRRGLLLKIKAQMGNETRPRVWMHCASLGEFEQGRPLLESIRASYPQYAIVLTFFSPSGYQVRKSYKGADFVFYLPLDNASNAKHFIADIYPSLAIFVKYDLWYYYLRVLHQKQIPTLLIDAIFRPQQGFFRWYGAVQRQMLRFCSQLFIQDTPSVQLLSSVGIEHVMVSGDTRFDRVLAVAKASKPIERIEQLSQHYNLLIAGSTWAEDEQLMAQFLPHLPSNWKLILVPHEVDESRISSIEKLFSGKAKRWSEWREHQSLTEPVLVVDTIGLLLKMYRYGKIAWIGGGLGKGGVHNVLEAAVYGLPCAYGPVYHKYQEAVDLIACNAAVCCTTGNDLIRYFNELVHSEEKYQTSSEAAKHYVASKSGATQIILNYLVAKNWLKTP
ncbi:MAG: glycosyltransferase N-terminal domain-containing protein [Phycisphaerales bacterium]|nr:glycosyltransferase N-terminal domain-containing protein [Phycisphaerales bacterium]